MTFLEAALEILKREGRPLHFKELTERAMGKKLLTFVGRTPEVTMQTQLTAAIKKAPGNPFVRVKPGVFGLLRYPELTAAEREADRLAEEAARAEKSGGRGERGGRDSKGGRDAKDAKDAKDVKDGKDIKDGKDGKDTSKPDGKGRRGEPRADAAGDGEGEAGGRRRSRRGGRGRRRGREGDAATGDTKPESGSAASTATDNDELPDEPVVSGLSAEARAAALAETGVLEGDDDMQGADDEGEDVVGEDEDQDEREGGAVAAGEEASGAATVARGDDAGSFGEEGDDEDDEEAGEGDDETAGAEGAPAGGGERAGEEGLGRRRRRRRRRRRGGEGGAAFGDEPATESGEGGRQPTASFGGASDSEGGDGNGFGEAAEGPNGAEASAPAAESAGAETADGPSAARRIPSPVDAAIEILRGQPPGRGVHVRQIADSAVRRRLVHGEPNEAWRVIRTALAAEPKERLRAGLRPRVRSAGSGLFALARRPPDTELERAEQVFGDARRALRERTMAALERRIAELPPGAFEALARVLLQREGFGPTTFVKRVDGTIYVEALRGRGTRPSKCLIALRPGATTAGRRAMGELRAGIRARNQDEGVLLMAGRLAPDAISEWKQPGPPTEIADGSALAETCARHGIGVQTANIAIDFVDADFFADLAEG